MSKAKPAAAAPASATVPDAVKVMLFDVGHGDCTLIEFIQAGAVAFRCLTDGGLSLPAALATHLKAHPRHDGKPDLDVVILSHVDADHQDGLPALTDQAISIGEYWGPCLPTFKRLRYLFKPHVQNAVDKAQQLETQLEAANVPIHYPLEGHARTFASGRVTLSILSPAARLMKRLSLATGDSLRDLLASQPLQLEWLNGLDLDDSGDAGNLGRLFVGRSSLTPGDFDAGLPPPQIDAAGLLDTARRANPAAEPDFFGNSVLNDTSLVVAIDIVIDGVRRKRILLTGDQENWSYLAARHSGGIGVDLLKAPHHGGRVYLRDHEEAMDELYLWLRPRTVLVSASGRYGLPRQSFRDSLRKTGASLLCPNTRGFEPLTSGANLAPDEDSCFARMGCSRPAAKGVKTIVLRAVDEHADAYACLQGNIHNGPAPIVVIKQELAPPKSDISGYTWGALEHHADWIAEVLDDRHKQFSAATIAFADRVQQSPVSLDTLAAHAKIAGRHDLAAAPDAVLKFGATHRKFWVAPTTRDQQKPRLYRSVSAQALGAAGKWARQIPRIIVKGDVRPQQLHAGHKLDILLSADWTVLNSIMAGMLNLPIEQVDAEVLPQLLQFFSEHYTISVCDFAYPRAQGSTIKGACYIWLEKNGAPAAFPDLEHADWDRIWGAADGAPLPPVQWERLKSAAEQHILIGNFFHARQHTGIRWLETFTERDDNLSFPQRFAKARWQTI